MGVVDLKRKKGRKVASLSVLSLVNLDMFRRVRGPSVNEIGLRSSAAKHG